ncbi:MAG: hypothetical protein A3J46_06620 [Candidatus Yanofskybacteria bacterium RIFCSPHIGHO2_02_FULL_41_11]|uniref:Transglycosylase SLT domain-containing protein n=1 Tax=Candidatus Yanofskybacteria bacterium RIFCSPHIGHO2_02_FULL_41_11 TaxID=1802675 RepID=A0A1F8F8Z6_9BACT|nr:MAG: hypothetical protein A3J46_06620 [Candidatus Yanofskybacteria bacterium RIFCSPHIGHO2_02_FULL_41_11]
MQNAKQIQLIAIIVLIFSLFAFHFTSASVQDEIADRQRQIEEIQRQIEKYQAEIGTNQSKARTLENEIAKLNAQVKEIALAIRSLELSINQTSAEINLTESQISDAETKIAKQKEALAEYIQIAYENDQETLTEIIFKNDDLSDFFSNLNSLRVNQENLKVSIQNIRTLKTELENKQNQLEDKRSEFEKLKNLEVLEKISLDQNKNSVSKLLKDTKGQESKFQELVSRSKKDIEALKNQIGYLIQNGVSAEEAVKYGHLAAIGAGIRPAFLLAELEQESALGSNVGKCYITDKTSGATRKITNGQIFSKGIHPTRDLPLFLNITAELGKDPFQTPISCGSSWGGAMGIAQFIPSTWMGYRDIISRITGHSLPNPWNIEDGITAAAAKLSKDGASSQTRAGEIAASKRYYCGNAASRNAGCINYASSVQRLAAEIAKNL